jgi:hypothetical protein
MFPYASEICIEKAQSDQRASGDADILINATARVAAEVAEN